MDDYVGGVGRGADDGGIVLLDGVACDGRLHGLVCEMEEGPGIVEVGGGSHGSASR